YNFNPMNPIIAVQFEAATQIYSVKIDGVKYASGSLSQILTFTEKQCLNLFECSNENKLILAQALPEKFEITLEDKTYVSFDDINIKQLFKQHVEKERAVLLGTNEHTFAVFKSDSEYLCYVWGFKLFKQPVI